MKRIKIGVIPAAGRGKRISELPLTRILPKPMLPILNKPILEYVIGNMKDIGVELIYIIVNSKKESITEYFRNGEDWDIDIKYIEQKELKGIAQAISLTEEYISEPFLVILGDDFTIAKSLNGLIETFWKNKAWAVEGVVFETDIEVLKRTCCVISEETTEKIKDIIEKPTIPQSNLRGTGVYLFDPIVFDFIKNTPISTKRNEKEITDTVRLIAKEGKAYGYSIPGINVNINTLSDIINTVKSILK